MNDAVRYTSPLRYPGGKSTVSNFLRSQFPQFKEYREPFVGGGSVFFNLKSFDENLGVDHSYWINDKFPPVAWLWMCFQDPDLNSHLVDELRWIYAVSENGDGKEIVCKRLGESFRAELHQLIEQEWEMQSSLDIGEYEKKVSRGAFLAFFLNRNTFSGALLEGGITKGASLGRWTESSIERIRPLTGALHNVRISCLDYSSVIDSPGEDVFMFLDPPYYSTKGLYYLHKMNHEHMAEMLKGTKHKFLLTYDNDEHIRKLYSWANVEEFQVQYGMDNANGRACKKQSELLIRNY